MDSSKQTRDQLNDTYIYHKRIADERRILVVTFSQSNRKAYQAAVLRVPDFAEDVRKAANVDLAIGICQTAEQEQIEMATLFVIVAREGRQGCGCNIQMHLETGQFCLWSKPMGADRAVSDGSPSTEESTAETPEPGING
jgi:hypothetical protein